MPEDVNYQVSLNESSSWAFTVALNLFNLDWLNTADYVEIYDGVRFITEGYIQRENINLSEDSGKVTVEGRGPLDFLYKFQPAPRGSFENMPLIAALREILFYAEWDLGDYSTLSDVDGVVTEDVRTEKNLMAQITKLLKIIPNTHFRYGGKIDGVHRIDIGQFNVLSPVIFTDTKFDTGTVLSKPQIDETYVERVAQVEPLGGELEPSGGFGKTLNLQTVLEPGRDPQLAYDSNYPIVEVIDGERYVVVDMNAPGLIGGEVTLQNGTPAATGFNSYFGSNGTPSFAIAQRIHVLPGQLREFSVYLGNASNSPDNYTFKWTIASVNPIARDTVDYLNLDVIATGEIAAGNHAPNTRLKIVPDTEVLLNDSQGYWFVFELPDAIGVNFYYPYGTLATSSQTALLKRINVTSGAEIDYSPEAIYLEVLTRPTDDRITHITQKWDDIQSPRTSVNLTALNIYRLEKTLYERAKTYLQAQREVERSYSFDFLDFTKEPITRIRVGDQVTVKGNWSAEVYNPANRGKIGITKLALNETLRVETVEWKGKDSRRRIGALTLTPDTGLDRLDEMVYLYAKARPRMFAKDIVTEYVLYERERVEASTTESSVLGDAYGSDGRLGKKITLTVPSPAISDYAGEVLLIGLPVVTSTTGVPEVEIIQYPDASTDLEFIVLMRGRSWAYTDSVTATAHFLWR